MAFGRVIRTIWNNMYALVGCLLFLGTCLIIIFIPFYIVYQIFFYYPEPLSEVDLNPIRNPQSSPYQIESKGIRSITPAYGNNQPPWQRIVDSNGLCYTVAYDSRNIHGPGWFNTANNMRFFDYQFHKLENNIPQSQAGLRIHYLRGTVHRSYWSSMEPTLENIREHGLARSPTDLWKDCANGVAYGIHVIEIQYSLHGKHYHFKIPDELDRQFQQDLILTFE